MNPTSEQIQNRELALANLAAGRPQNYGITPSTLNSSAQAITVPQFPTASPTQLAGEVAAIPTFQGVIDSFNQPVQQETQQRSLQDMILQSLGKLSTRQSATIQAENAAGIPEQQKKLKELSDQLNILQTKTATIPLEIQQQFEGRGATRAGVEPVQTAELRKNAIAALGTSALAQAAQGNLQLAQQQVDRAIQLEFEPEEQKLQFLGQLYAFNKDDLERIDKKRADALNFAVGERSRLLAEQKTEREGVYGIMSTASKFGAPADIVSKLRSARSIDEAIELARPYLRDPQAAIEMESARIDILLKKAQIKKVQRETQLLGEPSEKEKKEIEEKQKEKSASLQAAIDKKDTVGVIEKHSGLSTRVGTTPFARGPQGFFGTAGRLFSVIGIPSAIGGGITNVTGSGDEFAGAVHKLVSGLSIDNLIAAKARGATFGALSEGELKILSNAASAINDWEIRDDDGKATGFWDIDEASFKRELATIRELADRAITQSGGVGSKIPPEDQALIDSIYKVQFNPASYY